MNEDILNLYKSLGSNNNKQESKLRQSASFSLGSSNPRPTTSTLTDTNSHNLKRSFSTVGHSEPVQSIGDNDSFSMNLSKRKREKCNKGLRHFSMKVCEKVKQKNVTSYNEVADELVNEYCSMSAQPQVKSEPGEVHGAAPAGCSLDYWSYDQKNVRRRVYDALNVLMAMNIISKEKKEIKWIGLPCNKKQECLDFEAKKRKKQEVIDMKSEHLKDLIIEQIAMKSLIERNKKRTEQAQSKIDVPCLILSTDKRTQVDFTITSDRKEYLVQFDNTFEVNSHLSVMKNLKHSMDNAEVLAEMKQMLPKLFEPYAEQLSTSDKLEPICLPLNHPDYSNLTNQRKGLRRANAIDGKASKSSTKSQTDQENESFLYEEDEEEDFQLSGEENESDLDGEENPNEGDQMLSDEDNSSDNDDDNSLADSLSF